MLKKIGTVLLAIVMLGGLMSMGISGSVSAAEEKVLVTVGDSITEGVHFPNLNNWSTAVFENCYPNVLVKKLNALDDNVSYTLYNAGISGAATVGAEDIGSSDSGLSWMKHSRKKDKIRYCDILTIMLGTNDAPSSWSARCGLYEEKYREIVEAYREINPSLKLYVLTSPYTPNPSHTSTLEDIIVPMQKNLAKELGGEVIDIYTYTKDYCTVNGPMAFIDPIDLAKGLSVHPGESGHRVIAEICYAAMTGTEVPAYITKKPTTTTRRTTTTTKRTSTTTKRTSTTTTVTKSVVSASHTKASPSAEQPKGSSSSKNSSTSKKADKITAPTLSPSQAAELVDTSGDKVLAKKNGLTILAEEGAFPSEDTVEIITNIPEETTGAVLKKLPDSVTQFIMYVVDSALSPERPAKGVFRIPDGYATEHLSVLFISDDAEPRVVPAVLSDDKRTITAQIDELGLYVLAEGALEEAADEAVGTRMPMGAWIAIGAAALLLLCGLAVALVLKLRHRTA